MSFFSQVFSILKGKKGDKSQFQGKKFIPKPKVTTPVKPQTISSQPPIASTEMQVGMERLKEAELLEARAQAKELVLEAKDEAFKLKKLAEEEVRKVRSELVILETKIAQKEETVDKKSSQLEEKDRLLRQKEQELLGKIADIEKTKQDLLNKLEKVANLTKDEAKKLILEAVNLRLKEEKAKLIQEIEREAKEEATKRAKQILVDAMQKGATDYVAEYTVSSVKIADEDMKGRIIGKEGRNIRSFEQATGVDVDLDEEGVVRLSSFDPVRREVAKIALERLMADGRIQPIKIEEIVKRIREDLEKTMFEEGEKLCHLVSVYNLPIEIIALLGRFKYRFSYGQNLIAHTLEETRIGVALSREVGADVNIVRLGCLLHDIGKVIMEKEGSHVQLGVDFLRKYGLPEEVISAVAEHHEDKPFSSIESTLVYIADAISGSRPGARFEDIEQYIKRLKELEDMAKSFKGVKDAYAFQAGREVRVIVNPDEIDDAATVNIAHELKEKIEKNIQNFPGQIKITVIREMRVTQTAK